MSKWQQVGCDGDGGGGIIGIATYPASGYSSSTAAVPRSVAFVVAAGIVVAVVAAVARRRCLPDAAVASVAGAVHRCSTCRSAQTAKD